MTQGVTNGAILSRILPLVLVLCLSLPFPALAGGRILYVDSYHQGYEWSDGIEQGVRSVLRETGVDLRVVHMDAKHHPSEEHKRAAAVEVVRVIDAYHPDVVITSDDVAAKYVIADHYAGASLPFVFCGVNWDSTIYGLPSNNVTGMIEVDLVQELSDLLLPYARGPRTGYISGDTAVDHKITQIFNERYFFGSMKTYFARSMAEFEALFERAQDEVDILFVRNYAGIADWDPDEARRFVETHTRVPTGAHNAWMAPYALVTLAKVPQEQGQWAAQAALRILDGTPPSAIAVAINERARLTVNMRLAIGLGVVLDPALLEAADFVGQ